jgi:hypothetical protein
MSKWIIGTLQSSLKPFGKADQHLLPRGHFLMKSILQRTSKALADDFYGQFISRHNP